MVILGRRLQRRSSIKRDTQAMKELTTHAVILAGGRGTRFWPRSRTRTPKQLLNIVGKDTMLEQTIARLRPLIPAERIWTVTNSEQAAAVRKQVPAAARRRVLTEPVGRNTAAAIALAAIHVRDAARGDALLAVLPADHYIEQAEKYRKIVTAALNMAREPGRIVVLGIPPTRPETGFGYVERTGEPITAKGFPVFAVRRFTEKPELKLAQEYVASGNYPKLENISVDYAILEPATRAEGSPRVFVIPAEVGWSDIGSWAAVYELLAKKAGENVLAADGYALDAEGNFLWSPAKFVAAIGVRDLVVVETPDALLICPRDRAQDVGKIVKWLEEQRRKDLL